MIQAGKNYILIKTKKLTNDSIKSNILDADGEAVELFFDTSYSPLHHAKIDVEVVSVGNLVGGEVHDKYIGFPIFTPAYKKFSRSRQMFSDYIRNNPADNFRDFKGYQDFDLDIQAGDKVYIHYGGLAESNFMHMDGDYMIFKVHPSEVFCVVRDGVIIPLFGWIFVSPYYGDDIEDIEYQVDGVDVCIKGKVDKQSGLVIETGSKPTYLCGILEHTGSPEGFWRQEIPKGSKVLYQSKSEFENEVEGVTYYSMKQWDIIAVYSELHNSFVSVCNYVEVMPDKEDTITAGGLEIVNPKHKDTGVVKSVGEGVLELSPGDRVRFEKGSSKLVRPTGLSSIFLTEQDVYYKYV